MFGLEKLVVFMPAKRLPTVVGRPRRPRRRWCWRWRLNCLFTYNEIDLDSSALRLSRSWFLIRFCKMLPIMKAHWHDLFMVLLLSFQNIALRKGRARCRPLSLSSLFLTAQSAAFDLAAASQNIRPRDSNHALGWVEPLKGLRPNQRVHIFRDRKVLCITMFFAQPFCLLCWFQNGRPIPQIKYINFRTEPVCSPLSLFTENYAADNYQQHTVLNSKEERKGLKGSCNMTQWPYCNTFTDYPALNI